MNKIIIDKKDYERVMKGTKIDGKHYTVSLIKLLLNKYYLHIIKLLNNSNDLTINIRNHTYIKKLTIDNFLEFINTMYKLCKKQYFTIEEENKILFFKNKINYKRKVINSNNEFEYYFNGIKKTCSTKLLINIFSKDLITFKNIISNYKDINKDELMVLMKKFALFLNNRTENNNIKKNIDYILSITNDYEIVNKIINKEKPSYINKIQINKKFIIDIIKNIPTSFSKLEIALYIYIKLCEILSHDVNDIYRNNYTINHKNINRLKYINEQNNIIVCYEFVGIFAKLLELYNIDFEISGDQVYGRGHTCINIIYKESIICFDSTRGLVDCDLTKTKNHIRVCNINPIKANTYILDELNDSIDKVYDYFDKVEYQKYYSEEEYISKNKNNNNLSIENKIHLFFSKISETKLEPVDNIKYIYLLKKMIFNHNELNISIIEKRYPKNKSTLSIIFAFNINNKLVYYLYEYPNIFKRILREEIEYCIDIGVFNYIKYLENKIPGINEDKKRLYKK